LSNFKREGGKTMSNVSVDILGLDGGIGEVAQYLVRSGGFDVGARRPYIDSKGRTCITVYVGGDPKKPESYRTIVNPPNVHGTLRRDEWKALDDAILQAARYRLGGIDDLVANGLVYNLGNALGTTILEWHDISDSMAAVVSMDGVTRGPADRPKFQYNYLPIPIVHADYEFTARELAASRGLGNPLDTTAAEHAARKVKEKLEDMLFTDVTFSYGEKDERNRNTIYSYVNHPDRNTGTLTYAWTSSSATGATILKDVINMIQDSIDAYHYGPWVLYVPTAYQTVLYKDYDTVTPGTTILERIKKLEGIKGVKVIDTLETDNVLLVQMTPDVVRLVKGFDLQNVEWSTEGGMVYKYKVMTIQVPQIRSDQNGKSGIVHYTT